MWKFRGNNRPSFAIEPRSPGQESVWDYPRPPVCRDDSRVVVVRFQTFILARTTRAIRVLETASPPTFYLPRCDVRSELLLPTSGNSYCEWKGQATYWSLKLDDGSIEKNVGWSYEDPTADFQSIRGYLSFYPARLTCLVDGEVVRPQPGGFYGGWVTDEVVGPYKGEAGTHAW